MLYALFKKIWSTITFRLAILWPLAVLLCVVIFTLFENRATLEAYAEGKTTEKPKVFSLDQTSKTALDEVLTLNDPINSIMVVSADLRINTRYIVYFNSKMKVDKEILSTIPFMPLFTTAEANNIQLIKFLNGDFNCAPYSTTTLSKLNLNLHKGVSTICGVSLPPYYGFFVGYLVVYLAHEPTLEEQQTLKNSLSNIGQHIFFEDISPQLR